VDVGVVWIVELLKVALGQRNKTLGQLLLAFSELFEQRLQRSFGMHRSARVVISGDGCRGHACTRKPAAFDALDARACEQRAGKR